MGTYIAELYHDPQMSPRANAAVREHARRTGQALPRLMEEKGITLIGDWHLDPEHRAILIFEAASVEDVRDVLYGSGFMHWCDGRIYPSTPLPDMHKWAVSQEPVAT